MTVGVLRLVFHIPGSDSLKAKRRIIRPLSQKIRRRFNVAVAEIEDQDSWQFAVLGCVCISTDSRHADAILAKVADLAERDGEAVLTDYETELTYVF